MATSKKSSKRKPTTTKKASSKKKPEKTKPVPPVEDSTEQLDIEELRRYDPVAADALQAARATAASITGMDLPSPILLFGGNKPK